MTRVSEGYPGPPFCCDPDQGGRALFSAAIVSRISAWRICSFQPPPARLAKSLRPDTGAFPVNLTSSAQFPSQPPRTGTLNETDDWLQPTGWVGAVRRFRPAPKGLNLRTAGMASHDSALISFCKEFKGRLGGVGWWAVAQVRFCEGNPKNPCGTGDFWRGHDGPPRMKRQRRQICHKYSMRSGSSPIK